MWLPEFCDSNIFKDDCFDTALVAAVREGDQALLCGDENVFACRHEIEL